MYYHTVYDVLGMEWMLGKQSVNYVPSPPFLKWSQNGALLFFLPRPLECRVLTALPLPASVYLSPGPKLIETGFQLTNGASTFSPVYSMLWYLSPRLDCLVAVRCRQAFRGLRNQPSLWRPWPGY